MPARQALALATLLQSSIFLEKLAMETLLVILAVLFVALIIVIPLAEKYAPKGEPRDYSKITRWIIPLMALAIVLQLVRHYFM